MNEANSWKFTRVVEIAITTASVVTPTPLRIRRLGESRSKAGCSCPKTTSIGPDCVASRVSAYGSSYQALVVCTRGPKLLTSKTPLGIKKKFQIGRAHV